MLDEEAPKDARLINASMDIECLRDNLLILKNNIIDQAGLLKALEIKSEQLKRLELENLKISQDFLKLKEEKSNLPQQIEELNEENNQLRIKLNSQELINEQVVFNNDVNIERSLWKLERKRLALAINSKEKKISTLQALHEQSSSELSFFKVEHLTESKNLHENFDNELKAFNSKIKKKKLKINKQRKLIVKKCIECEKYRKKYKLLKKSFVKHAPDKS